LFVEFILFVASPSGLFLHIRYLELSHTSAIMLKER